MSSSNYSCGCLLFYTKVQRMLTWHQWLCSLPERPEAGGWWRPPPCALRTDTHSPHPLTRRPRSSQAWTPGVHRCRCPAASQFSHPWSCGRHAAAAAPGLLAEAHTLRGERVLLRGVHAVAGPSVPAVPPSRLLTVSPRQAPSSGQLAAG